MLLPSKVATQARMASRAAVLSPGDGDEDCWGRHTASRSHSPSVCCLSFSVARAPPRRHGHTVTVTVPVLVMPDAPSRRMRGTWRIREEDGERDSICRVDTSTRLAMGPAGDAWRTGEKKVVKKREREREKGGSIVQIKESLQTPLISPHYT